jgi:hypothetical protein
MGGSAPIKQQGYRGKSGEARGRRSWGLVQLSCTRSTCARSSGMGRPKRASGLEEAQA